MLDVSLRVLDSDLPVLSQMFVILIPLYGCRVNLGQQMSFLVKDVLHGVNLAFGVIFSQSVERFVCFCQFLLVINRICRGPF